MFPLKTQHIHTKLFGLSLLSGALLVLSWYPINLFPLLAVAFVPLFFTQKLLVENHLHTGWAFLYGFTTFFIFNVGTTWWIWNASPAGSVFAIVLTTMLMVLPFLLQYFLHRRAQAVTHFWPFIIMWLSMEYVHSTWEFAWPWLLLGNGFAGAPFLVQWYEYTGAAGGTLWVLWLNQGIFKVWNNRAKWESKTLNTKFFNLIFFRVFAPVFLSLYVAYQYRQHKQNNYHTSIKVVVVQPNIDPYKDKYSGLSAYDQTQKMLDLAKTKTDSATQLIVFPETALVGNLNENAIQHEQAIWQLSQFASKYPTLAILTGAETHRVFEQGEYISETARPLDNGMFYDAYNAALLYQPQQKNVPIYHKSILVPGVEKIPYSRYFKFMNEFMIDLGGTSGGLGIDHEPQIFSLNNEVKVAPVICYESVFGEYVAKYVQKGANVLTIITNDGWWGNTPGYQQHMVYASLRAIENRRYIARCANTGISGFIDDEGNILKQSKWWTPDALSEDLKLIPYQTFYTKHGNWIFVIANILTLLLLFSLVFKNYKLPR